MIRKTKLFCAILAAILILTSVDGSVFAAGMENPETVSDNETTLQENWDSNSVSDDEEKDPVSGNEVDNSVETEVSGNETDISTTTMEVGAANKALSGKCGDNLTWKLEDGVLTISGTGKMYDFETYQIGTKDERAPWIPYADTITKLVLSNDITYIGARAFWYCKSIQGELTLPDNLKSVGDYAFCGCQGFTGDLKIPDSVEEMGCGAFCDTGFDKDLILPSGIKTINDYVFQRCKKLSGTLEIPDSVEMIGVAAFSWCQGFTGDLIIPDNVKYVGSKAFEGCTGFDGKIRLSKNLKIVKSGTFQYCEGFTKNLEIFDGIEKIEEKAFTGCKKLTGDLILPDSITEIGNSAFQNCEKLNGKLKLPNKVKKIDDGAFDNCVSLTGTLTIPETVTYIGDRAFSWCKGFTGDLIIPDSVTYLGGSAFCMCSGFNGNLKISNSITEIKDITFRDCTNLTGDLRIGTNVSTIGRMALSGCNKFSGNIYIPETVIEIYGNGEASGSDAIDFWHFDNEITIYGKKGSYAETYATRIRASFVEYDFGVTRLSELTSNIPSGSEVDFGTQISLSSKDNAQIYYTIDGSTPSLNSAIYQSPITIYGDTQIKAIAVKDGYQNSKILSASYTLKADENRVGGNCGYLDEDNVKWSLDKKTGKLLIYGSGEMDHFDTKDISESEITIEKSDAPWMEYESYIKSLEIAEGVTHIGLNAFYGCNGIQGSLVIPDSVELIDVGAFSGCTGLQTLQLSEGLKTIEGAAFSGCTGLKGTLVIPDSVEKIRWFAFSGCSGFNSLKLSSKVTMIDEGVFINCTGLNTDLVIPEGVTTIESGAFEGCIGLEGHTVSLPDSLLKIEKDAFTQNGMNLDISIRCNLGTYAERWAKQNDYLNDIKIVIPNVTYTYTGKPVTPEVKVYDKEKLLVLNKDYKITYKNNLGARERTAKNAPYVVITGIGNYVGKSKNKTFTIEKKVLTDENISCQELLINYNGRLHYPTPVLSVDGRKLVKNKDFVLEFPDKDQKDAYKAAGSWRIRIRGWGNYSGYVMKTFRILDTTEIPASKLSVGKIPAIKYEEGKKAEPKPTITYKGKTLVEGVDYSLSYSYNEQAGKATMTITGLEKDGELSIIGSVTKTFTISGTAIGKANVVYEKMEQYTGSPICPEVTVTMDKGNTVLRKDVDYAVSYDTNVKAGKGTILIQGKGGYVGTVKKTFTIKPVNLTSSEQNVRISFISGKAEAAYSVSGAKPEITVFYGTEQLKQGQDYTVSYANNKKLAAGTDKKAPAITVKGKGNYTGTLKESFSILSKSIIEEDICITAPDVLYNAKGKYQSVPVVTDQDGKKLKAGKDYKITEYIANGQPLPAVQDLAAGTEVTIRIQGMGSYQGERTCTYRITEKNLSKAGFKISPVEYTGEAIQFSESDFKNGNIKVTAPKGSEAPQYGTDFVISDYKNNINKGTAQVTFKGISKTWGGTKTVTFKINVKKM